MTIATNASAGSPTAVRTIGVASAFGATYKRRWGPKTSKPVYEHEACPSAAVSTTRRRISQISVR